MIKEMFMIYAVTGDNIYSFAMTAEDIRGFTVTADVHNNYHCVMAEVFVIFPWTRKMYTISP